MTEWVRVDRQTPCPICDRPDWCGIAADGSAVVCMRVESDRTARNGGWIHRLDDGPEWPRRDRPVRRRTVRVLTSDGGDGRGYGRLAAECCAAITRSQIDGLAASLGLSVDSLTRMRVGWSVEHRAWTWPMTDAAGRVTGIRLRLPDGRKLSVRGGREGLFIPTATSQTGPQPIADIVHHVPAVSRLVVCEGPTDAAAMLDMGHTAVGRPSCHGGVAHVVEYVRRTRPAELIVAADGDAPGMRGAERLAAVVLPYVLAARIITPPGGISDTRAWRVAGATAADVRRRIDAAEPITTPISIRRR